MMAHSAKGNTFEEQCFLIGKSRLRLTLEEWSSLKAKYFPIGNRLWLTLEG